MKTKPSDTVTVPRESPDETDDQMKGRAALQPSIKRALTTQYFTRHLLGDVPLMGLVEELRAQADLVKGGSLARPEAMLTIQAHTLDSIFNELARRAALNMGEYLEATERYLKLALKAQSQCRTTIETLAQIKNPSSVAFVKQANISAGPQQVNNGPDPSGVSRPVHARAGNSEIEPNKQLEQSHGERLECGSPATAAGNDTTLEAVGAINGTDIGGR